MTRAQACADMDATGRQYVSAVSGLPVRCGPQTQRITAATAMRGATAQPAPAAGPTAAARQVYSNPLDSAPGSSSANLPRPVLAGRTAAPYSNPLDRAPGSTSFAQGVNAQVAGRCAFGGGVTRPSSNVPVRCGPQVQSPSGLTAPLGQDAAGQTVGRARMAQSGQNGLDQLLNSDPPPYSNPAYAQASPAIPQGYAQVWDDGRLNPNRGLPTQRTVRYAAQPRPPQAVAEPRLSTRVAPQTPRQTPRPAEQISGHRYVQVGSYATRDQAQSVAQALRARGLPMRIGVYQQGGREMRMVLAGPFANDSQLNSALGTARNAGYGGAFTRR